MAESTVFPLWMLVIGGLLAVLIAGGVFALIFWAMGRGRDDDISP
jgi:hypothetical protein